MESRELGCEVKPAKSPSGKVCQSILLYDNYAAGYASQAGDWIQYLFARAKNKLHCPRNCDSACPHCVLDFDQRFAADSLDRHAALQWLNESWLQALHLPEANAFFGESSQAETRPLAESIFYALGKGGALLRCFTGGEPGAWQVAVSPLRLLVYKLAGQGMDVEIVLPPGALEKVDVLDRYLLAAMADAPHIRFAVGKAEDLPGKGHLLAETGGASLRSRWALKDESALSFSEEWGKTADILVRCDDTEAQPASKFPALSAAELRPVLPSGDRVLHLCNELSGPLQDFGKKFWQLTMDNHEAARTFLTGNVPLAAITYSDRYLVTPFTVALFTVTMAALAELVGKERLGKTAIDFRTWPVSEKRQDQGSWQLWHNWPDTKTRNEVLSNLFAERDLGLNIHDQDKNAVVHKRELVVQFASQKRFVLLLDQGFSYWHMDGRSDPFDFAKPAPEQAHALNQMIASSANKAKAGSAEPTILVITK